MRIASWNIKGVKGKRQELLLDWLCAQQPDVVALQKINAQEEDFDVFARAGYFAEAHCAPPIPRGNYGVAILSLRKPRVLLKGLPGQEKLGPRLLTVEVDGLEFSSVYAPYKKDYPTGTKIEWFDNLTAHLSATRPQSGRRVLCGDFNVVPKSRFGSDVPRNSPNYHSDVRAKFSAMLNAAGLFDLYAAPPPGWSDRFSFGSCEACLRFSRVESRGGAPCRRHEGVAVAGSFRAMPVPQSRP